MKGLSDVSMVLERSVGMEADCLTSLLEQIGT